MAEPAIDITIFNDLKTAMGADFISELLQTYFEDTPQLISAMYQSLANSDAETFRRSAHSLKSNSASFGAMQLSALCKELEMLGKEGKLAAVGDKVDRLEELYNLSRLDLKQLNENRE